MVSFCSEMVQALCTLIEPLVDRCTESTGGLPLITYAPRGRGGRGQAYYTFLVRITCKKGGKGVQIACQIAYVINGRPLVQSVSSH